MEKATNMILEQVLREFPDHRDQYNVDPLFTNIVDSIHTSTIGNRESMLFQIIGTLINVVNSQHTHIMSMVQNFPVNVVVDSSNVTDEMKKQFQEAFEEMSSQPLVLVDEKKSLIDRSYRYKDNPDEKYIVEQFNKEHGKSKSMIVTGMKPDSGIQPNEYLDEREESIVDSTIQWIMSPVGKGFIREILKETNY